MQILPGSMPNYLKMPKQQQVTALLALDWSYRRIEAETGVRRETVSHHNRRRRANAAKVFPGSVAFIEPPHEEQVGDLFDHLQRIGDAPRPAGVPDAVDLAADFAGDHSLSAMGRSHPPRIDPRMEWDISTLFVRTIDHPLSCKHLNNKMLTTVLHIIYITVIVHC